MRTSGTYFKAAVLMAALAISASGAIVAAQDDTMTMGFVPPALTSPFHVAMVDGATARGEELGWTIDVQAPTSEGDFAAFVTTVQQLLEKGVDGLSINPIGTDSAVTAVKAANEKGVPILAHNFITPFSEGEVASYIGYDQWGGAEKLAAATCDLIAGKYGSTPAETTGKVYILLGIDSIFSHRRTGGFKAGLEKNCPNVEVVGEQTANWLRQDGQAVASQPGRPIPTSTSSTATATRWPSVPPSPASSSARSSTRTSSRSASTATSPPWTCSARASSAPRWAWTR